jgi:hypothetical protein
MTRHLTQRKRLLHRLSTPRRTLHNEDRRKSEVRDLIGSFYAAVPRFYDKGIPSRSRSWAPFVIAQPQTLHSMLDMYLTPLPGCIVSFIMNNTFSQYPGCKAEFLVIEAIGALNIT